MTDKAGTTHSDTGENRENSQEINSSLNLFISYKDHYITDTPKRYAAYTLVTNW